jgi:hypothetical protein
MRMGPRGLQSLTITYVLECDTICGLRAIIGGIAQTQLQRINVQLLRQHVHQRLSCK